MKGRAYARLFLRENLRLFGQRLSGPPYLLYCKLPLVNPVLAYVYRLLQCLTHKVDVRKFLVIRITPSPVPWAWGKQVSLKCEMPENCALGARFLPLVNRTISQDLQCQSSRKARWHTVFRGPITQRKVPCFQLRTHSYIRALNGPTPD